MVTRDRLTREQAEALIAEGDAAGLRREWVDGVLSEKMPTFLHGYIVALLAFYLNAYLRVQPIGFVTVEARYRFPDDDPHSLLPDLAFDRRERGFPVGSVILRAPDLAVEVQSDGQSKRFMLDRALHYLAHGTDTVWLIYPEERVVEVLTTTTRQFLTRDGRLTGGDLLPGFDVAVADLFPPADTLPSA